MDKTSKKFYFISSPKLIFAPYIKAFIHDYHEWMKDPYTLFLTGSEPLNLEEELTNQISWLKDPKKYTFILLEPMTKEKNNLTDFESINSEHTLKWKELIKPIGDVNLFFHDYIEENEAEIDIMIGDKTARGKGYSKEAVKIMLEFGYSFYRKEKFIAKIKSENYISRKLFESIGFEFKKEVRVFDECIYELDFGDKKISPKEFFQLEFEIRETKILEEIN